MSKPFRLKPSYAGIWASPKGCRGWGKMMQQCDAPIADKAKTDEGLTAHCIAEIIYEGGDPQEKLGKTVRNFETVVDQDMIDFGHAYVRNLRKLEALYDLDNCDVEIAITFDPAVNGFTDYAGYSSRSKTLVIADYKYGHGVVEPHNNETLIIYAAAWMDLNPVEVKKVVLAVDQPRQSHPVSRFRQVSYSIGVFENLVPPVEKSIQECEDDDAELRTGNHCRRCPARNGCAAVRESVENIHRTRGEVKFDRLMPKDLREAYDMVEECENYVKALKSGIEAQVHYHAEQGVKVNGLKAEQGYGNRAWTVDVQEIIDIGAMFDVKTNKGAKVMTPTQAINAGIPEDLVKELSNAPKRDMKIIKTDTDFINNLLKGAKA